MMIIWCIVPEISSTIDRLFVILGYFWPFYPLTTQKIKIFKNEKNYWRYHHFKHEYHEWKSWCMIPEIWSTTDIIFSFGPFFALLHPLTNQRIKFWKKEKNTWRYHHFTQVHHKWQSYDIWFLKYEVHQTEFFCHLGPYFSPFTL